MSLRTVPPVGPVWKAPLLPVTLWGARHELDTRHPLGPLVPVLPWRNQAQRIAVPRDLRLADAIGHEGVRLQQVLHGVRSEISIGAVEDSRLDIVVRSHAVQEALERHSAHDADVPRPSNAVQSHRTLHRRKGL